MPTPVPGRTIVQLSESTLKGILIEEARTNSIRNNTMAGAAAPATWPTNWYTGLSGTATFTLAVGIENGLNYLEVRVQDSVAYGSTISFDQLTQIVAADTETWCNSFFVSMVAGSTTNLTLYNRIAYRTAAGALVTSRDVAITPTAASLATQRVQNTFTASGATIERISGQLRIDATGAIDITLRIGMPQLEKIVAASTSDKASSPIATSAGAATRNADVCGVTGTAFSSWYNQAGGTFSATATVNQVPVSGTYPKVLNACDATGGTENITLNIWNNTGVANCYVASRSSSTTQLDLSSANAAYNVTLGTAFKRTVSFETNNAQACANGGTLLTDTVCTQPTPDRMYVGSTLGTGSFLNGYAKNIKYWNRPLNSLITSV